VADQLEIFKVFCEGGLNTNRDVLSQSERAPGSALRLVNYEPSTTGGYRRISGYSNNFPDLPGQNAVLGVSVYYGINDGVFAIREPEVQGDPHFHWWDESEGSWVSVAAPSSSYDFSPQQRVRVLGYNWYTQRLIITDGVNPATLYDGTSLVEIDDVNAPTAPAVATTFKNHMFLAGDPSEPTNVWFSAPANEEDYAPGSGAGVINVGFEVVQIKAFRDSLFVFGRSGIKKIVGTNIADFAVEEVTQDLGCVAADSVIEIGGDLMFMGPDGLRPISATDKIGDVDIETISKDIQSYITDISYNENLDNLCSVIIRSKSQFRYFFAGNESQGVLGGLRKNSQSGAISFEFSQLLGLGATCASSGYIGQYEYVIHGDENGKVYRQEFGTDFDGDAIFSLFQTPFYHMGDPEMRKHFLKLTTYLRAEGDANILMGVAYDYEDQYVSNPANYNLTIEGAAAYYNEAQYDSGAIFDGNPTPLVKTNISGSGTSISIKYVTNDTNASHNIQGMVLLFGVDDRR
jgi:hypothetical protein